MKSAIVPLAFLICSSILQAQPCLRPRPSSNCKMFLLIDYGFYTRLNSKPQNTIISPDLVQHEDIEDLSYKFYYTSDVGLMKNMNTKYAFGVSHFIGLHSKGEVRGGMKLWGRRWFGPDTSIDFAPGFYFWNTESKVRKLGFMGSLHFNKGNVFGISVMYERLTLIPNNTSGTDIQIFEASRDTAFYLGAKFGSEIGALLHAVSAIVAIGFGIAAWTDNSS